METKSWILIRILLNRFHSKSSKDFLSLLPKEEAQKVLSQDVVTSEIDPVFVSPNEFLKSIHYSWVAPHVQKLPLHLQGIVVSALPQPLAMGLKKYLNIPKTLSLPAHARTFFIKKIYDQVKQSDILPLHFLPKEELSDLLNLNRIELIELIDFLGLYDLAEEVRYIVDKKNLQNVYKCLDNKKMQFVRICLHQKSRFSVAKLDLKKWNGDCSVLLQQLHQRGLYRLGKALSGAHPHFMWYFSRKIDTGRSAIIYKYYKTQASPGIASALVQQVTSVMNFLKQKSET